MKGKEEICFACYNLLICALKQKQFDLILSKETEINCLDWTKYQKLRSRIYEIIKFAIAKSHLSYNSIDTPRIRKTRTRKIVQKYNSLRCARGRHS